MWLDRMINELPKQYLKPRPFPDLLSMPPEAKVVGELTDEELKLLGVYNHLRDQLESLEKEHESLHIKSSVKDHNCAEFIVKRYTGETDLDMISHFLCKTLEDRLKLLEFVFAFDKRTIYAMPDPFIEKIRSGVLIDDNQDHEFGLVLPGDPKITH